MEFFVGHAKTSKQGPSSPHPSDAARNLRECMSNTTTVFDVFQKCVTAMRDGGLIMSMAPFSRTMNLVSSLGMQAAR